MVLSAIQNMITLLLYIFLWFSVKEGRVKDHGEQEQQKHQQQERRTVKGELKEGHQSYIPATLCRMYYYSIVATASRKSIAECECKIDTDDVHFLCVSSLHVV